MSGFSMEVNNSDPNMVICGFRVLLGSQDVAKTPAYVEVNAIFYYNLKRFYRLLF